MTCNFTVCPHDTAQNLPGWFFLNTYLQRQTGMAIHFQPFDDFDSQRRAVLDGGMQDDEKGQRCLRDLGFQGFERVDDQAFATLVKACETTW